ncbi:MAG: hypothetical protein ACI4R8_01165 [Candidatus Caccovivens sp.]
MIDKMLIKPLKKSLGILVDDTSNDAFYEANLEIALSDLMSDDIGKDVLETPIGRNTLILYAQALIEKKDIATHPTINLLKNKLSAMTKGERYK